MENASKALLIAGAILIVILLIGVGMMVYNGAMSTVNKGVKQMDTQAIQMHNAQFTQYEGSRKGTSVKALLSSVIANNADTENQQVTVNNKAPNTTAQCEGIDSISTTASYTITMEYTSGIITNIKIEK